MSRLFLAVPVPEVVKQQVAAAIGPLRERYEGLRWTPSEQLHVTLAFIGATHVAVARIESVLTPVLATAPSTIRLAVGAPGRFGRRVLWLGVVDDPPGTLATLGGAAQRALAEAELPVDRKPVRPHLTLARARGRSTVDAALVAEVPPVDAGWEVEAAVLYGSSPAGHGRPNRHSPVARLSLRA